MKTIHARKILTELHYDFGRMLEDDGLSCESIKEALTKRLERLKDNNWQKVDWS